MEMPAINECQVSNCAYNTSGACHALAITVGNSTHPVCETFDSRKGTGGDPSTTGQVGACHMSECRHNVQLECQAPGIAVGYVSNQADCLTYAPA